MTSDSARPETANPAQARHEPAGGFVCSLPGVGVIGVTGEDRARHLQAQTCNDVATLQPGRHAWNAHLSAKGRVLSSFVHAALEGGHLLILPRSSVPGAIEDFARFALRAQAHFHDFSDRWQALGVCGDSASGVLERVGLPVPGAGELALADAGLVVRWPDRHPRFLILLDPGTAPSVGAGLADQLARTDDAAWRARDIACALPWLEAPLREQFLPQMLGLDLIGGVSFTKGCFPGQEVVARARYLGEVKRRPWIGTGAGGVLPVGAALYPPGDGQQAGTVLLSAPIDAGSVTVLAVCRTDVAGPLADAPDGPARLNPANLPYPPPEAERS